MLNLIITVISIALVAILAASSVFYGGKAWSEGSVSANASHIISSAQQTAAGLTLYFSSHSRLPMEDNNYFDPDPDPNPLITTSGKVITALRARGILTSMPSLPSGVIDSEFTIQYNNAALGGGEITAANVTTDVCQKIQERAGAGSATQAFGCDAGGNFFFHF